MTGLLAIQYPDPLARLCHVQRHCLTRLRWIARKESELENEKIRLYRESEDALTKYIEEIRERHG
jgi:hypothetical protein